MIPFAIPTWSSNGYFYSTVGLPVTGSSFLSTSTKSMVTRGGGGGHRGDPLGEVAGSGLRGLQQVHLMVQTGRNHCRQKPSKPKNRPLHLGNSWPWLPSVPFGLDAWVWRLLVHLQSLAKGIGCTPPGSPWTDRKRVAAPLRGGRQAESAGGASQDLPMIPHLTCTFTGAPTRPLRLALPRLLGSFKLAQGGGRSPFCSPMQIACSLGLGGTGSALLFSQIPFSHSVRTGDTQARPTPHSKGTLDTQHLLHCQDRAEGRCLPHSFSLVLRRNSPPALLAFVLGSLLGETWRKPQDQVWVW